MGLVWVHTGGGGGGGVGDGGGFEDGEMGAGTGWWR